MKRSGAVRNSLRLKIAMSIVAVFLTSVWLYSSGDVYYLDATPLAIDALPGHEVMVKLSRPDSTIDAQVNLSLESLSPDIAEVPGSAVIPAGSKDVWIPVYALRSGSANIRASANSFGNVTFSVNVLDGTVTPQAVVPSEIKLQLGAGEAAHVAVSTTLPADSIPNTVDIALAIDARPSFEAANARLANAFPEIVTRLKATFPSVSFAFSVTKFQDFGGPGQVFRKLVPPSDGAELARPSVLLLPMTVVDTPEAVQAVKSALETTPPGGNQLSLFSTSLEALGQIAQGTGFDANANGSATESGLAGVAGDETTPGFLNPGPSGDVPPFSSKPDAVPSAGTIGGVGFRTGAQKIVLLATNTVSVAPVDRARTFPETITGTGNISVSTNVFQEVPAAYPLTGTFPNSRFGPVSASATAADPVNAVAPAGAVTVPEVFQALADQDIEVVSFFQVSQMGQDTGYIDPAPLLQAIARLTGALDENRVPLTFELIGANTVEVANQIVQAIRPVVTQPRPVTLRAVGNDAGFGFSFTPDHRIVGPGETAEFDVTITGNGQSGSFEIQFVSGGAILGRIPVTITGSTPVVPTITGLNPTSGPIGTQVTVTGTNFPATVAEAQVRFGGLLAQVLSITPTSLVTVVPAGSVAGKVNVNVTVANQVSNDFPFTVLHTITSFTPTRGTGGTPFTITGSAFASTLTGNTVSFGGVAATITQASNTEIQGIVPSTLVANIYPVQVTTNEVTTFVGNFELLPSISGITPSSAPGNATVTITGAGFSQTAGDNVVIFTDTATGNTATAAVSSASFTSLQSVVPASLVAGPYTVSVTVNGRTSNSVPFTVLPAITSATPATVRIGETIRISGTGFSSNMGENTVSLNGTVVPILSGSSSSTLLVTAFPGLSGTTLDIVVTTRGAVSAPFRIAISQVPVILEQTIGTTVYPAVYAIFETRTLIAVTVSGADPNGDVVSASFIIRDGANQVLGSFSNVNVSGILGGQVRFVFRTPFENANHFTAASTVTVQLKDSMGNVSDSVVGAIINPDVRQQVVLH
jgi:hypothetical protein